jgi:chromosome segregation protein
LEEAKAAIPGLERQTKGLLAERDEVVRTIAGAEAKETVSQETLQEEIEEAERRLERLRVSREAYVIAVEVLEEADEEFRASHLARLNSRTTSLLEQITGRRCSVRLDERLEPQGLERAGQSFELEQLSQGLRDQLYFALRLAAVEEISGEQRMPMLLDDPFVNFDDLRLKATLDTLDTLSQSHQVVLLAHDRRYCDWRSPARILER